MEGGDTLWGQGKPGTKVSDHPQKDCGPIGSEKKRNKQEHLTRAIRSPTGHSPLGFFPLSEILRKYIGIPLFHLIQATKGHRICFNLLYPQYICLAQDTTHKKFAVCVHGLVYNNVASVAYTLP